MNSTRISITGPESTGKSWLAEKLATHFRTNWVPEVARGYLNKLGRPYQYEDIVLIAKEQLKAEDLLASTTTGLLFCDTDLLVTRVWSLYKYGKCDPWITEKCKEHRYGLYLLCNTDLPWKADPLREHPMVREELFRFYMESLGELEVNYSVISGSGPERLKNAISAVEKSFKDIHR